MQCLNKWKNIQRNPSIYFSFRCICTWDGNTYSIILAWWLIFCESRSNHSSYSWKQELWKHFLIGFNLIVLAFISFPANNRKYSVVIVHSIFKFSKFWKFELWINSILIDFRNFGGWFLGFFCVSSSHSNRLYFCRNIWF